MKEVEELSVRMMEEERREERKGGLKYFDFIGTKWPGFRHSTFNLIFVESARSGV